MALTVLLLSNVAIAASFCGIVHCQLLQEAGFQGICSTTRTIDRVAENLNVLRESWNFDDAAKWRDFARVDGGSGELVVGLNLSQPEAYVQLSAAAARSAGRVIRVVSSGKLVLAVVVAVPFENISLFASEAENVGFARYVEPNLKLQTQMVPNDPSWDVQWAPKKIKADWAWNTTSGNSSVLVAVVDTGINYYHPDLIDNYAPLGYNWVDGNNDPMDDSGHGTHVAGIIAASLNNRIGIAGLAQVRLMAEKALDVEGTGYASDLADAIIHATEQGAEIINMSWGDTVSSAVLHDAITYAYDSGVLLVAAAGNDNSSTKLYPAAYSEVISVAATDQNDAKASFSNWGGWIELSAPGVNVYSTFLAGYQYESGTSMAAPHVSGVAALVWSRFPNATRDWVRDRLHSSTDDLGGAGFDVYFGYGRVNAERALTINDVAVVNVTVLKTIVGEGYREYLNVTVGSFGAFSVTLNVTAYANSTAVAGQNVDNVSPGTVIVLSFMWNTTAFARGKYIMSVYVSPVPNETDVVDNSRSDGWVFLSIAGDVTGVVSGVPDDIVDVRDFTAIAHKFGTRISGQGWDANIDVNSDGVVNMRDVGIGCKNFGKT
jgi:subtilisin family serine protease